MIIHFLLKISSIFIKNDFLFFEYENESQKTGFTVYIPYLRWGFSQNPCGILRLQSHAQHGSILLTRNGL